MIVKLDTQRLQEHGRPFRARPAWGFGRMETMKYKDREVSKGEALRIAADLDMRDGKVNDLCAFRCSECNGFIAYRRGRVPDHFRHRRRYAEGGRRHKAR